MIPGNSTIPFYYAASSGEDSDYLDVYQIQVIQPPPDDDDEYIDDKSYYEENQEVTNKVQKEEQNVFEKHQIILREHGIELQELLGTGNFGWVYVAMKSNVKIAVKIQKNKSAFLSGLKELSLSGAFDHPNILKTFSFIVSNQAITMEFCENGSLEEFLIKQTKPISWGLRFKIASEIAQGMAFLHRRGLVHRDLRCANILLSKNLDVKISDFGIALWKGQEEMISKEWLSVRYAGKQIYKLGAPTKSLLNFFEFIDIRCFGIILCKLLLHGDEVKEFGKNGFDSAIELSCPPSYAKLINLCFNKEICSNFSIIHFLLQLIQREEKIAKDTAKSQLFASAHHTKYEDSIEHLLSLVAGNQFTVAERCRIARFLQQIRVSDEMILSKISVDTKEDKQLLRLLGKDGMFGDKIIEVLLEDLNYATEVPLSTNFLNAIGILNSLQSHPMEIRDAILTNFETLKEKDDLAEFPVDFCHILKELANNEESQNENVDDDPIAKIKQHMQEYVENENLGSADIIHGYHVLAVLGESHQVLIPKLLKMLQSETSIAQRGAADLVRELEIQDKDILDALLDLAQPSKDATVREAAIRALGKSSFDDDRILKQLEASLQDPHYQVKGRAVEALALKKKGDDENTVMKIASLLDDKNGYPIIMALQSLKKFKIKEPRI